MTPVRSVVLAELDQAEAAIELLRAQAGELARWAELVTAALRHGGRLLAAGNGGSAAHAQHLTSELVGRFRDQSRPPLSAWCLSADTSAVTAIGNDDGFDQVFARQVEAHGRAGDVLVLLSTSGRSPNVVAAASAGRRLGLDVLALTGRRPNPLALASHRTVAVGATAASAVQDAHQVAVHALCAGIEERWRSAPAVLEAS